MEPLTYCLITPSFRTDLERCRLLIESVERWVAPHVQHYLVIDRRDVPLFQPLASARTQIRVVEEIAPPWILRIPRVRRFWLSLRSRPVRNWILQQIVKLSIAEHVREDVLLFVDSDTFFVAPYDPRTLEREGRVPLFMELGQRGLMDFNNRWHRAGARLLGLPVQDEYDSNFIGNVICWRRDNALALLRRLAEIARRDWPLALVSQRAFSEYILYGLFVTEVLKERSGHWNDALDRTLCYWLTTPLDEAGLIAFKARAQPHHHSVMVSAKSFTPVELIRRVFA